jgi:predicted dehydrogenase
MLRCGDERFHLRAVPMRARIRIGVVGCGLIAQTMHLPHLRELGDRFEVAALCDLAPEPLAFARALFPDARSHVDWPSMLEERLDAVLVLTPGSHGPVAVAAAQAGMHVFVEKPMCFSVAEGEEMIGAAQAAGVVLLVGYMKRYDPAYEELSRTLDAGALTFARITTLESPIDPYATHHPRSAAATLDPSVLAELVGDDHRRLTAALGSDDPFLLRLYREVLLDSMVHELNAVRALLGEPDTLHSARAWGTPSGISLDMSFGDVEAVFAWVDLPGIARYAQDWSFYGADRRATLGFPSPLLRNHPTQLVTEGGEPGRIASWRTEHIVSYEEAFKRELCEFAAAIAEGREPRTDGADGLRDVALCAAIVRGHLDGRPVTRPADPALAAPPAPAPGGAV